jgi:hypothetical protein
MEGGLSDTILKGTHSGIIPARFGLIWKKKLRREAKIGFAFNFFQKSDPIHQPHW